jgi:hypothetical protein
MASDESSTLLSAVRRCDIGDASTKSNKVPPITPNDAPMGFVDIDQHHFDPNENQHEGQADFQIDEHSITQASMK